MRTGHHGPDFTVKDCKGFYSLSVNNEDEISDFPPKAFMRHVCFLFLLNLLLCDSLCVCVCVCLCVCVCVPVCECVCVPSDRSSMCEQRAVYSDIYVCVCVCVYMWMFVCVSV